MTPGQIRSLPDEALNQIASAEPGAHPDGDVLAAWEELAARGVVVEFDEPAGARSAPPPEDLLVIATFSTHVQAHFAHSRLLASGVDAFLIDAETVRVDWLLSAAIGGVKLAVPSDQAAGALEILNSPA